jgi:hypothetical protein
LGIAVVCSKGGTRRVPRGLRVLLGALGALTLLSAFIGGVAGMLTA